MIKKILLRTKIIQNIKCSLYFILIIIIFISCSKENPISGTYQGKDKHLSAIIIDSTLYLMIGADTAIIYDLKIHSELKNGNNTFRIYKVGFSSSASIYGFRQIEFPLRFEYDNYLGGTLSALFVNNDSFNLGGYRFQRAKKDEAIKISNNWSNVMFKNADTQLMKDLPD